VAKRKPPEVIQATFDSSGSPQWTLFATFFDASSGHEGHP
jgi:hypothetical protein